VKRLKVPTPHAVGYLECLWWSVYESPAIGPDGVLQEWTEEDIAACAEFDGDGIEFTQALTDTGFMEYVGEGVYAIHDYEQWAPEYVKKRWERTGWKRPVKTFSSCRANGGQREDMSSQRVPTQPNPTQRNQKKRNAKEGKEVVPAVFDDSQLQEKWIEWVQFRKETKHSLTKTTIAKQVKKLKTLTPSHAIATLEASMEHGWQGLFPDKIKEPIEDDEPEFGRRGYPIWKERMLDEEEARLKAEAANG
jgi:hypothetical protein